MPKFAAYDQNVAAPSPVIGWYDTDALHYPNLPTSGLLQVTDAQWAAIGDPNGWAVSNGALVAYVRPPVPVPILDQLATLRYAKETAGVMFQPSGATAPILFPTDRQSQAQYTGAAALQGAGGWVDGTPWKLSSTVFVPLTGADVAALAKKVGAYVQACFAHEATLSAQIASNPATDITQGWPSNA